MDEAMTEKQDLLTVYLLYNDHECVHVYCHTPEGVLEIIDEYTSDEMGWDAEDWKQARQERDRIAEWLKAAKVGDSISGDDFSCFVEQMTQAEFDALPAWEGY